MAFQFTVPDVAGATPAAMANARGPDYLVSIPAGHALFGIGAAYFRPGGAAVPGAAAGAAPVRDSIPLRTLEGLFGSCVVVPDDDDGPRFGTHAIQPALLGRVADRCVAAGAGGLFDLGSFINLVRELARDGGVLANAADFVELAPFGIPGAVGERPAVPAQWTPSFALANISISRFRDVSGCAAAYAYLRLASGVAGIAAERRGDAFSNAGRMLSGQSPIRTRLCARTPVVADLPTRGTHTAASRMRARPALRLLPPSFRPRRCPLLHLRLCRFPRHQLRRRLRSFLRLDRLLL